jgi:hypothetical protein
MKRALLLIPLLALFLLPNATSGSRAQYILQIDLYGDYVVPPVETRAWGFVRFFFNEDRSAAEYGLDVKGLSGSSITGMTIREGGPDENGPVVRTLSEGDFIVTGGFMTLTPGELEQFASGAWYLTLTTVHNPEGELRGQIVVPADFFSPEATGAKYPPPSRPPAEQPEVVAVTPPSETPDDAAVLEPVSGDVTGGGSAPSGGESGGLGAIRPPNTGDGGLR